MSECEQGTSTIKLVHVGPSIMQLMHCAEAAGRELNGVINVRNFWAMMKTRSQYSKMVVSLVSEVG